MPELSSPIFVNENLFKVLISKDEIERDYF